MKNAKKNRLTPAIIFVEMILLFMYMLAISIGHNIPDAARLSELRAEHNIETGLDAQTLSDIDNIVEKQIFGTEDIALGETELLAEENAAIEAVAKVNKAQNTMRLVIAVVMIVLLIIGTRPRAKAPFTISVGYGIVVLAVSLALGAAFLAWAWTSVRSAVFTGGLLAQAMPKALMRVIAEGMVREMAFGVVIFLVLIVGGIVIAKAKYSKSKKTAV